MVSTAEVEDDEEVKPSLESVVGIVTIQVADELHPFKNFKVFLRGHKLLDAAFK